MYYVPFNGCCESDGRHFENRRVPRPGDFLSIQCNTRPCRLEIMVWKGVLERRYIFKGGLTASDQNKVSIGLNLKGRNLSSCECVVVSCACRVRAVSCVGLAERRGGALFIERSLLPIDALLVLPPLALLVRPGIGCQDDSRADAWCCSSVHSCRRADLWFMCPFCSGIGCRDDSRADAWSCS